MKQHSIFVGAKGTSLVIDNGTRVIAIRPAATGEQETFVLIENGQVTSTRATRINGIAIGSYLAEHGFVQALPSNAAAKKLSDALEMLAGARRVAHEITARTREIAEYLSGSACTFVPFESSLPPFSVVISRPDGPSWELFDNDCGFSAARLSVEYCPEDGRFARQVNLAAGWLLGQNSSIEHLPRVAGCPVALALLVIANSGIGSLVQVRPGKLPAGTPTVATKNSPRHLCLKLANGDLLTAGLDTSGTVCVHCFRNGEVSFVRADVQTQGTPLSAAIGTIAAAVNSSLERAVQPLASTRARTTG